MRSITATLIAIVAVACTSSDHKSADLTSPVETFGNLGIQLTVSGDPLTGPAMFEVSVDGARSYMAPNRNYFMRVRTGPHSVSISSLLPPPSANPNIPPRFPDTQPTQHLAWCYYVGSNPTSVNVEEYLTTLVTLQIECPPMGGTATLVISSTVTGGTAPPGLTIPVALDPLNGARRFAVRAPAATTVEYEVPAGVFNLSVFEWPPNPNCWPGNALLFLIGEEIVIYPGSRVSYDIAYQCE